jgi:hypothetical protein
MMTRFTTKVDLWLGLLVGVSMLIGLGAVTLAAVQEGAWTVFAAFAVVFLVIGAVCYPTDYTFEDRHLIVRSGLIRYRIGLEEIRWVRPSREAWSSPAWSLDRLKIQYGEKKWILISPKDREGFLNEIRARTRLRPHEGGLSL